ncbi:hypothetical protein GGX14DRAFT_603663 [Mycena pura]|uniref:Uncharacterized protein n=1 Tax=Mycena pura TaxID=153505 RepID=A0AAD6URH2_9AGAR|nr:hypothetical protein GGX14DRAFT_603663 [Mycena pura]
MTCFFASACFVAAGACVKTCGQRLGSPSAYGYAAAYGAYRAKRTGNALGVESPALGPGGALVLRAHIASDASVEVLELGRAVYGEAQAPAGGRAHRVELENGQRCVRLKRAGTYSVPRPGPAVCVGVVGVAVGADAGAALGKPRRSRSRCRCWPWSRSSRGTVGILLRLHVQVCMTATHGGTGVAKARADDGADGCGGALELGHALGVSAPDHVDDGTLPATPIAPGARQQSQGCTDDAALRDGRSRTLQEAVVHAACGSRQRMQGARPWILTRRMRGRSDLQVEHAGLYRVSVRPALRQVPASSLPGLVLDEAGGGREKRDQGGDKTRWFEHINKQSQIIPRWFDHVDKQSQIIPVDGRFRHSISNHFNLSDGLLTGHQDKAQILRHGGTGCRRQAGGTSDGRRRRVRRRAADDKRDVGIVMAAKRCDVVASQIQVTGHDVP